MPKHPLHTSKSPLARGDWKKVIFIYTIQQIVPYKKRGGSEGDGVCSWLKPTFSLGHVHFLTDQQPSWERGFKENYSSICSCFLSKNSFFVSLRLGGKKIIPFEGSSSLFSPNRLFDLISPFPACQNIHWNFSFLNILFFPFVYPR